MIQEREVERVGGKKAIPLDIRVLATTDRDMSKEVAAGRFREDLYYRLNVFPLAIPSLRERPGDIVPLARHFALMHGARLKRVARLSPEAESVLVTYHWPGNVRELENTVQRALILSSGQAVSADTIRLCLPHWNGEAVRLQRHIGKDGVPLDGHHRIGIRLRIGPRSNPKVTGLGIDRVKSPILTWLHPRNVIPERPDLPSVKASRWNHHGKIRLAALAGERGRHKGLLPTRRLDAQNQHVFRHPPFLAAQPRRNAKRQALFAQKCVATIRRQKNRDKG